MVVEAKVDGKVVVEFVMFFILACFVEIDFSEEEVVLFYKVAVEPEGKAFGFRPGNCGSGVEDDEDFFGERQVW